LKLKCRAVECLDNLDTKKQQTFIARGMHFWVTHHRTLSYSLLRSLYILIKYIWRGCFACCAPTPRGIVTPAVQASHGGADVHSVTYICHSVSGCLAADARLHDVVSHMSSVRGAAARFTRRSELLNFSCITRDNTRQSINQLIFKPA